MIIYQSIDMTLIRVYLYRKRSYFPLHYDHSQLFVSNLLFWKAARSIDSKSKGASNLEIQVRNIDFQLLEYFLCTVIRGFFALRITLIWQMMVSLSDKNNPELIRNLLSKQCWFSFSNSCLFYFTLKYDRHNFEPH